jgi:hypothetical protein
VVLTGMHTGPSAGDANTSSPRIPKDCATFCTNATKACEAAGNGAAFSARKSTENAASSTSPAFFNKLRNAGVIKSGAS